MSTVAMNLNQIKDVIKKTPGIPKFLWGPPGIGKSAAVYQVCDERKIGLIDVRLSQFDPTDIRGLPYFEGETAKWATPDFLPQVKRDGPSGILFLDELNSAPPMVQAAAYQLCLDRRVGSYFLPDGWEIIAAGNRVGDRGVVFRMPSPLANRFMHVLMQADVEVWKQWAYAQGIDSRIIGFISFKGEDGLFAFDPESDNTAFATPRTWEYTDRILKSPLALNHIAAMGDNNNLFGAVAGSIGDGLAIELMAYIQMTDQLPDIDLILQKGAAVKPPEDISIRHAVLSGMISRLLLTKKTASSSVLDLSISNSIRYVDQFEPEFATLYIKDLGGTELRTDIRNNGDFRSWNLANRDLILG